MKIVLLGSGNVATVLGKKFLFAHHQILQVYSPTPAHALELASQLDCPFTSELSSLDLSANLYLVAVTDAALLEMSKELALGNSLVVHTAGSLPMDILAHISHNYGVLYPLQSLHKDRLSVPEIPFLVDANKPDSLALIEDLALSLSGSVTKANDEERMKYHLSAVIVNNFTNHLYTLTEAFCQKEGVDFRILLPLIKETVDRLQTGSPKEFQTGPAIRKDLPTIQKHINLLTSNPILMEIYRTFSDNIMNEENQEKNPFPKKP